VVYSLFNAVRFKYDNLTSRESKEEIAVLFLSIATWVGVPIIDYWNIGQAVEATTTNFGFLLLFSLQVKRHIKQMRVEHQRLIDSEQRLLHLNNNLQEEVTRVTNELEIIIEQQAKSFINLSIEIKDPLASINDSLIRYVDQPYSTDNLTDVKSGIEKLNDDISNLVKMQKVFKGLSIYHQGLISNFGTVIKGSLSLINTALQVVEQSEHKVGGTDKNQFEANCSRFNLTRREIEVAKLMEKGHTNVEIGDLLFISKRTVDKHIENLFEKAGAVNKLDLINKLNGT
jgi:DNA-binding CsgD family transcriptional regulator